MAKRKDNLGRNLRTGESQRKNGLYMFRWTVSGKEHCIYAKDLNALREKEKQIQRDLYDGVSSSLNNTLTLNDMFDRYISTKTELKKSTRSNYVYMYEHYVRDGFGKRKIVSIKYSDVVSFYNSLIKDYGFKPNSLDIIHTILHPTFNMAYRDGMIRTNPSDGVMADLKKSHNWEKPAGITLTIPEQTAFIDYVSNSPIYKHWLPVFTVLLGTGCRISEFLGLRWEDCDFENNIISINHNLIYRMTNNGKCEHSITTPKTAAGIREIPMLTDVKKALLQIKQEQWVNGGCITVVDGYTNFIFSNRFGEVLKPKSINEAIKRIVRDYNEQERIQSAKEHRDPIIIRNFSAHSLRHTFCTRFCENETNIKAIQSIMGHADISTTMNIYCEATRDVKRESISNLDGKIKIC